MPDLPSGSDDIIKGFFDQIPDRMMAAEEAMNFVLGRMVTSVHDIMSDGFGDKLKDDLQKKVDALQSPLQMMMEQARDAIKVVSGAEEMKLKLYNTYEQIRLKEFDKNAEKEKEMMKAALEFRQMKLQDSYKGQKGAQDKLLELQKEFNADMEALEKKSKKDRLKLQLSADVSGGDIGASFKLAGLEMMTNLQKGMMGIGAWAIKTGIEQTLETSMAVGKVTAARANATGQIGGKPDIGLGGSEYNTITSGVSPVLATHTERLAMAAKIYSEAPRLIGESAESFRGLTGYLGNFGISIDKSSELLIAANRDLGFSAGDLTDTYGKAAMASRELGLSVMNTAELSMEMVGSLRLVGLGTRESIAIMKAMPKMTDMGTVTASDLQAYSKAVGQFLGNLSPSMISGMSMFLNGGGMPMGEDLNKAAKSAPQMMAQMYTRLKDQMGGMVDPKVFAEQFTSMMGINIPKGMAGMGAFDKFATALPSELEGIFKDMGEKFKPSEQLISEGNATLATIAGTMKAIDNVLKELFTPLATSLGPLVKTLAGVLNIFGGGNLTHIAGAAATGAGIGSMFGPGGALIGAGSLVAGELMFGGDGATPGPGNTNVGQGVRG